jgi:hypothetical protein
MAQSLDEKPLSMRKTVPLISLLSTTCGICISAFLSEAFAQSPSSAIAQPSDPRNQLRPYIIGCFLLSLFICFLVCLFILLYSKDKDKVTFAADAIKTLTGFFIGSITGYLG